MATTIPGMATTIPGKATTIPTSGPEVVAFRLEWVVVFRRNGWSPSTGIGGRLRPENALHELRDFFPGYGGKKLHGILAADDAPEDVREKVLQEGIYLARVHDGHFELQVPEDFQPRAF